jgi:hypothetical protein
VSEPGGGLHVAGVGQCLETFEVAGVGQELREPSGGRLVTGID